MSGNVIVYEAESLFLDTFYATDGDNASGGQLIRLGGCDYSGTASTSFNEASGLYQVTLWIQDEFDGQSTVEVVVNGAVVGTITLDQDDDGWGSNNGGFSSFTLDDILINQGDTLELRGYRDGNEFIRIDKLEFVKTGDIGGGGSQPTAGTETLMTETFDGRNYGDLSNSANVESSDFYRANNSAVTNGNHDGTMTFRSIDLSGYTNAKLTLDAKVIRGGFEQWGTQYGDMVRIELVDQDGNVTVLDQFTGTGNALTGSVTGQVIDKGGFDGLTYDLPAGMSSFQLRIVSDISARCEKIAFDNVTITADPDAGSGGGNPPPGPVTITLDAVDDAYSIGETEGIAANILVNDTTDAPGGMTVTDVNALGAANAGVGAVGQAFTVTTAGGRTGTVTIDAQGNLTFDGGTNFVDLNNGQTDSFQLQYTVRAAAQDQPKHNLLFVLDISNSTVNGNNTQQDTFVGTGVGDVNGDGLSDTVLDAQIAGVIAAVQNLIAQGADPAKIDIGIVTFSGKASGYTNIDAETLGTFALDDAALINTLTGITRGGWTNYEAGLQQARDWFASQQGDGAINKMYFLSDGRPAIGWANGQYIYQDSSDYGDEVAAIANTYGAEIHAIGVGANSDLAYLNDLDNTNGAEQVLDTTSLTAMLEATTDIIVEDTATITVTINGEGQLLTVDALDDAFSIAEDQGIADNIIDDDLLNGVVAQPGELTLTDVMVVDAQGNQVPMTVGQAFTVTTAGGRTGTVTVDAQGNFTFYGGTNFLDMMTGDTDSFRLAYTVEASTQQVQTHNVDFDGAGLSAGTIVSDQIGGVTIRAERAGHAGENAAMIFDADNPTGGDWDLSQPGEGNVLIITEDFDSSDPDDNAGGGTFFFDFDSASTVTSLTFLDTEEPSPQIRFYDQSGNLISTLTGPTTANGGMATMNFNVANVARMEIDLQGSGAIAGMAFDQSTTVVTASDTAFVDVVINGDGVPNLLPVAVDDALAVDENATGAINILANDDQGDGPASIIAIDGGTPDGTPFTVTSTDGRTATVTLQADGTLTLDPGSDFLTLAEGETRDFVLNYTIEDSNGDQSTASVLLTVNGLNEGPIAVADVNSGFEDTAAIAGNVLINDSDPNGDAISVVMANGQAAGTALALSGVSSLGRALDGTLTVNANGSYSFVPGAGYAAMAEGETVDFSVSYTIEDVHGARDYATLTITVNGLNEGPIATANVYATGEGVDLTGNIIADDTGNGIDSDPNGDAFSVVDVLAGGVSLGSVGSAMTVTSAGGRTGTLTVNADGTFTFQPGTNFDDLNTGDTDTVTLEYTIEDIHGARSTANFVIDVQGSGSGGGNPGGGPAINVMFVVDASSSMFVDKGVGLPLADQNGDGVANSAFDLAYWGISDFIAELQAEAATLGVDLNIGLTGFDDGAPNQGGLDYGTFTYDAATGLSAWNADVLSAGTSGSSIAAPGITRGAQWFSDMGASLSDDNQMIILTDGQLDTAGADAVIAEFQASFGGDVHARYTGSLGDLGANFAALAGVIDALDSTTLNPMVDPQMLAWDQATMDAALTTADVLAFV